MFARVSVIFVVFECCGATFDEKIHFFNIIYEGFFLLFGRVTLFFYFLYFSLQNEELILKNEKY